MTTFLKVRKQQPAPIGGQAFAPTWFVIHSSVRDFEPGGCSWPHLIRFAPYTTNVGHQVTEADCESAARSYAACLARTRPDDYEYV